MGLEVATYIDGLVISNPAGTDDRSQGDDHIRLVKSVLKNTFPNITGPITLTQAQINAIKGNLVPVGFIGMWSGAITNIPSGWKLCNGVGTISNGSPVPNLVDRFIMGSATNSGGNFNIGQTGGSKDVSYTGSTASHTLTVDQIPSHTHTTGDRAYGFNSNSEVDRIMKGSGTAQGTAATGGGQGHSHNLTISVTNGNLPPYYVLAFIIKD